MTDNFVIDSKGRRIHLLKAWPIQFEATCTGEKTHEFRKDDRGFLEGDYLMLQSFDPSIDRYLGDDCFVRVDHLTRGPDFGIPEGYVCMSIKKVDR